MTMMQKLTEMEQMERRNRERMKVGNPDRIYAYRNEQDFKYWWQYELKAEEYWDNYFMRPWEAKYELHANSYDKMRYGIDHYTK